MRHKRHRYSLGIKQAHRKLLIRNLVTSLFRYERIITTIERAKLARKFAEPLITLAKKGYSISRYQQVYDELQNKSIIWKLFRDIAPRFLDRQGGYTRILKLGGSRWTSKNGEAKYAYNNLKNGAKKVIFELVVKTRQPKQKTGKVQKAKQETSVAQT